MKSEMSSRLDKAIEADQSAVVTLSHRRRTGFLVAAVALLIAAVVVLLVTVVTQQATSDAAAAKSKAAAAKALAVANRALLRSNEKTATHANHVAEVSAHRTVVIDRTLIVHGIPLAGSSGKNGAA